MAKSSGTTKKSRNDSQRTRKQRRIASADNNTAAKKSPNKKRGKNNVEVETYVDGKKVTSRYIDTTGRAVYLAPNESVSYEEIKRTGKVSQRCKLAADGSITSAYFNYFCKTTGDASRLNSGTANKINDNLWKVGKEKGFKPNWTTATSVTIEPTQGRLTTRMIDAARKELIKTIDEINSKRR